jgi:hypothetical protein
MAHVRNGRHGKLVAGRAQVDATAYAVTIRVGRIDVTLSRVEWENAVAFHAGIAERLDRETAEQRAALGRAATGTELVSYERIIPDGFDAPLGGYIDAHGYIIPDEYTEARS